MSWRRATVGRWEEDGVSSEKYGGVGGLEDGVDSEENGLDSEEDGVCSEEDGVGGLTKACVVFGVVVGRGVGWRIGTCI